MFAAELSLTKAGGNYGIWDELAVRKLDLWPLIMVVMGSLLEKAMELTGFFSRAGGGYGF